MNIIIIFCSGIAICRVLNVTWKFDICYVVWRRVSILLHVALNFIALMGTRDWALFVRTERVNWLTNYQYRLHFRDTLLDQTKISPDVITILHILHVCRCATHQLQDNQLKMMGYLLQLMQWRLWTTRSRTNTQTDALHHREVWKMSETSTQKVQPVDR